MAGISGAAGRIWRLARQDEDLFALEVKVREGTELVEQRLRALEDRLTRLEAREGQMLTAAGAAATATASAVSSAVISDAITRVTRLEVDVKALEGLVRRRPIGSPDAKRDDG
jgi:hypothetical protein